MKKGTIILSLLGALLICAAAIFFFLKKPVVGESSRMGENPIQAVPVDALFFSCFGRLDVINETLNDEKSSWRAFADATSPMLSLLRQMESVAAKNKTANEMLRSETVISAHIQGKNEITYLWIMQLPSSVSVDGWFNFLKDQNSSFQTNAYERHSIVTLGSGDESLYCASYKGFALCSRSKIVLQAALRQLETGVSITDEEQFSMTLSTVGANVDVRFFLNHRAIQKIWPFVGASELRKYGSFLSYTANWTALDGQIHPDVLHLSGFTFPSYTDDSYLSLLLSQQGAGIAAWDFLPANTSIMLSMGFKDINRFFAAHHHYLEVRKQLSAYQQARAAMEEQCQRNVEDFFNALYPEELVLAQISKMGWLSALRSGNAKFAMEQFTEMAEKTGVKDFRKSGVIYCNPAKGLLKTLFGDAYNSSGDAYFTIHRDWIVFSDSLEMLANFVPQQNNVKNRMQEMHAMQYITNNASFVLYAQSMDDNEPFLSMLNPELRKVVVRGLTANPPGMACLQLRPAQDKLYVNLCALFSGKANQLKQMDGKRDTLNRTQTQASKLEAEPSVSKKTSANARIVHQFEVKNHYTNEKESLVQYSDNTIELLDGKGIALWSKNLNAPIIDTLVQIDFLKNGKLQMLFTTGYHLYLLDRNGNAVAPYPLTMQPKVLCGVAVFDYNKNRDYRIFLAHADNTIRAYDKNGRVVAGFKTFNTTSKPSRAPEFVRVGGRDYIIVFDEKQVYILDRQGNVRTKVDSPVAVEPHTAVVVLQNPAAIELTTTGGKKVKIDLKDGSVK